MIIPLLVMGVLLSSVIVPFAFADVTDERKKVEEIKAKNYQKKILNFDYDKIQSKDKGFKKPIQGESKHKEIKRITPINFKIIHSK